MRLHGLAAGALLLLPFVATALAGPRLADALAKRAGSAISGAAPLLGQPAPRARQLEPAIESAEIAELAQRRKKVVARWDGRRASFQVPRHGVRVSADKVLRLANAGMRPHGSYVPADGVRPAGLRLSGVSALGIGLIDGDVLTHAAGRPALSAGDVIGVVIGSRGRGVPEIGGRFWRNGEPWNLIVEQPYLKRSGKRPARGEPPAAEADTKPRYLKRGV